MPSMIEMPGDLVWASNLVVEEIESWCAERARMLGVASSRAGQMLVEFMDKKVQTSGPGMYGFSVTEIPFDDLSCRSLLARLFDELAHEIRSSETVSLVRWAFLHRSEPWIYPWWLAIMERVHAGIVRSFEEHAPPDLSLDLEGDLRWAVDITRWLPTYEHLRESRAHAHPGRTPPSPRVELDALDRLIGAVRAPPPRPRYLPRRHPELRVLLANRADLFEALGMRSEAAAAWREVATVVTDADEAKIALEIADRLEP